MPNFDDERGIMRSVAIMLLAAIGAYAAPAAALGRIAIGDWLTALIGIVLQPGWVMVH
jgi:hypothetical protein